MTGREIQERITDMKSFVPNALEFARQDRLELDTPTSSLEFLTLYAVLLFTGSKSYQQYSEEELINTYETVKSKLQSKGRICSKEFLPSPKENVHFILRGKECFQLKARGDP